MLNDLQSTILSYHPSFFLIDGGGLVDVSVRIIFRKKQCPLDAPKNTVVLAGGSEGQICCGSPALQKGGQEWEQGKEAEGRLAAKVWRPQEAENIVVAGAACSGWGGLGRRRCGSVGFPIHFLVALTSHCRKQ